MTAAQADPGAVLSGDGGGQRLTRGEFEAGGDGQRGHEQPAGDQGQSTPVEPDPPDLALYRRPWPTAVPGPTANRWDTATSRLCRTRERVRLIE